MSERKQYITQKFIKMPDIDLIKVNEYGKESLLEIIDDEIKILLNIYMDKYKQGFIDVRNNLELDDLNSILMDFYDVFVLNMFTVRYVVEAISISISEVNKRNNKLKYLSSLLKSFENSIKGSLIKRLLLENKECFLTLDKYNLNTLMSLPTTVKLVHFSVKPEPVYIVLLRYLSIPYIVDKTNYDSNLHYTYDSFDHKLYLDETLHKDAIIDDKMDTNKFKIGITLARTEDIQKTLDKSLNYVIVEPEMAYLFDHGVLNKENRNTFYKSLREAHKNLEIILSMPKMDVLYKFNSLEDDFILDDQKFLKHYMLYFQEIDAALSNIDTNIKISLPHLTDENQFKMLKRQIQNYIMLRYKRKVSIGINIETDSAYDYLDYYKKFDFTLIDLDRLFVEISEHNDIKMFIADVSYLGQRLKIRRKEAYLTGIELNTNDQLKKYISRGFKNFAVSDFFHNQAKYHINYYNKTRGMYKKKQ